MDNNNQLHKQLVKLGDMMGDGLHYEPGGKWIEKEYKKVSALLFKDNPELKAASKERNRIKADIVNETMKILMERKKCQCGGGLKQKRSGAKVCYCILCGTRYEIKSK